MRLEPVVKQREDSVPDILDFYMGKNTPDRQGFIIGNLKLEEDRVNVEGKDGGSSLVL